MSRKVWAVLWSWGFAVLALAGLFSFWIYSVEREKDEAMCELTAVFLTDPEPLPGPAGERSRAVRKGITGYREKIKCAA